MSDAVQPITLAEIRARGFAETLGLDYEGMFLGLGVDDVLSTKEFVEQRRLYADAQLVSVTPDLIKMFAANNPFLRSLKETGT